MKVIPVVMSPLDIINAPTAPQEEKPWIIPSIKDKINELGEKLSDIVKTILIVVAIVLGLIILIPVLPYIVKFLIWLITIPFKIIFITVGFLACSVFVFQDAFSLFINSCKDIGSSSVFFFKEIISIENAGLPSITEQHEGVLSLPNNFGQFWVGLKEYGNLLISGSNMIAYLIAFSKVLLIAVQGLVLTAPFLIIFIKIILNNYFKNINNRYNKDTLPLKVWKFLSSKFYMPCKRAVLSFVEFLTNNKAYLFIWAIIWLYNLNLLSVVLDLVAFYLYFSVSFDFTNIYVQVYFVNSVKG